MLGAELDRGLCIERGTTFFEDRDLQPQHAKSQMARKNGIRNVIQAITLATRTQRGSFSLGIREERVTNTGAETEGVLIK